MSSVNAESTIQTETTNGGTKQVAECLYEFLLAEILHLIENEADATMKAHLASISSSSSSTKVMGGSEQEEEEGVGVSADWVVNNNGDDDGQVRSSERGNSSGNSNEMKKNDNNNKNTVGGTTTTATVKAESNVAIKQKEMAFERAAAKIENLGYTVGYRLCERLAQTSKSLNLFHLTSVGGTGVDTSADASLEAVKFLCKEFWTEVFGKQIDKLQTNHRGVFVLKDHELLWLKRLPAEDERSRVAAIKLLAFPCGLIRGALSNLGLPTLVSCDFLADGKHMASCQFNIKIKS